MRFLSLAVFTVLLSATSNAQQPAEPTDHHELLKKEVGTWTATMTLTMPGSDKPMVLPGKETNQLIGELWLVSEYESGPFKGQAQLGYDPNRKKYVGTWIDNSSPHMSVMEGDYDKSKAELTMQFEGVDHATGKPEDMKSVTKFIDDDHRGFVMHAKKEGKWVEAFTIKYERAK